ncbi:MAG TPA: O-antigen ligase family protein, partial [Chloroflexota bacterium]|nr:O-antigen ligase family protein [Chloroflexota bacterium]
QGGVGAVAPTLAWLPELSPSMWAAVLILVVLAAGLPGLWTLAGVAAMVLGGLVLLRPEVAIYLLALVVPFGSLAEVDAGSFSITPTEPLVALLLVGWALRAFSRGRWPLPFTPLSIPLAAMLAAVAFSGYQAVSPALTLKEGLKWLELALVYLFVIAEMGNRRHALALVGMLMLGAALEGAIGAVQFVFSVGPDSFSIGRFMRAYGTFEQPNPYAGYLGMLLPLALGILLTRPASGLRKYLLATGLLALLGVAMSLSRGAWMGIGLALGLMAVLWSSRSRLVLGSIVLGATPVAVLLFLNLLPAEVTARLVTILDYFRFIDVRQETITPENFAVLERVAHWQAALDMIGSNPLFGVGAGNYPAAYEDFMVGGWVEPLGHAHNFYLNVAAEMGIPALLVYLLFVLVAIGYSAKWLVRSNRDTTQILWRGILLGILGSLVASSVHNMFDSLFVHSMNVQLGIILALGQIAATALAREERGQSTLETAP